MIEIQQYLDVTCTSCMSLGCTVERLSVFSRLKTRAAYHTISRSIGTELEYHKRN